jgi:hypothetical protein
MFARPFAALVLIAALAAPAFAQEQRGSIEGVVRDASGAVLPGATVDAQSNVGAPISTTTDATGAYRFPSLAPGNYKVTANLQGFVAREVVDVRVALGQIKKVDFSLPLSGVTETVQVTAETPIIDVRNSARQTNIRAEQIELLPHGRDFTTMVTQAPGANQESKLGGISIDGASAGENRFIIDGIETTDLQTGLSGQNVIADFIEEVQVKSSGFSAEFGGALGGVISAVTKSGTNDFHGMALFNFQGSATTGGRRPTLRQNLTNSDVAEYITYPDDDESRIEPGFSLGGPIKRDRLWFYAGYLPAFTTTNRTVNANTVEQQDTTHYIMGNISAQIANSVRARLAYNSSSQKVEGLLPALNGTDPVGTNYSKTSEFPNSSTSGNLDWVASDKLLFGIRGGYRMADQHDTNVTEQPRFVFSGSNNINYLDTPANLQHGTGFTSIPTNIKVIRDKQSRLYFQADGTLYARAGGSHQLKFGIQADKFGNDVLDGESRNLVTIRWNSSLATGSPVQRGTYGWYEVRSNGVSPKQGRVTEGNVSSTMLGFFVQDAWTINNKLTVNLGVRTERERVPAYLVADDVPEYALDFPFSSKFAPRAGFAYDVNGDGKWKVAGSWGIFYDNFKLELPRGSFGGDKWLSYYYTLDTFNWPTLVDGANCPPACNGTLIRGPIDFRHPSFGDDAIDPDLKPMKLQEASVSLDRQLNDVMAVGARYVHKQIDRAIEDTGFLLPDGSEGYVVANPGEGLTQLAFTNPNVAMPKAVRDYDAVEVTFDKRLASNWSLRTSYTWSRLFGNYSGLTQSDENGRTSPNVGRLFDYPAMMFQDGGTPVFGPLATDRPHQLKAQFIYQFGFGTSLGINQYAASGLPISREVGILPTSNYPVNYLGRGSDGRTPMFSQTDLYVQHTFQMGDRGLQLSLNVLNLFDQSTATGVHSTYQKAGTSGVVIDERQFYLGQQTIGSLLGTIIRDPRFLMDNAYQAPILARFGVKFTF